MEGYGYNSPPATRRTFIPYVPNSSRDEEGYVAAKTVVPVATVTSYGDDYYYKHSSPNDDYLQKKKVDDFLVHVRNEGARSSVLESQTQNDNYYYRNGSGGGDYGTYGRQSPYQNDNYDRYGQLENWNRSRPNPGWAPPPRSGTQVSEPTSDIGKAVGLLKEAANVYGEYNRGKPKDGSYYGSDRPNPSIWASSPGNGGSYGHNKEPTRVDKAMELAREAERLRSLKNKLLGEPKKQHKDDYHYKDHVVGREDQRPYGNNIYGWQTQKKYNGASF